MVDIIIPYKRSRWDDSEIMYCLRGIEKYLSGFKNIYIIGDKPKSVPCNIISVPFENELRRSYKERNIYLKLLWAVESEEVSDPFLFFNDDHFLLSNSEASRFPNYYGRWPKSRDDVYGETMRNTRELLPDAEFYDVHCPLLIHKKRFIEKVARADWEKKNGYCLKTLYAHGLEGQHYEDLKIYYQYPMNDLRRMIAGRKWFSADDGARGPEMLELLEGLYPNKNVYEK